MPVEDTNAPVADGTNPVVEEGTPVMPVVEEEMPAAPVAPEMTPEMPVMPEAPATPEVAM